MLPPTFHLPSTPPSTPVCVPPPIPPGGWNAPVEAGAHPLRVGSSYGDHFEANEWLIFANTPTGSPDDLIRAEQPGLRSSTRGRLHAREATSLLNYLNYARPARARGSAKRANERKCTVGG
jgi:hypothetical protein